LDWKTPLLDDAETDPYCTPYSSSPSDFACKKIKCIIERRLDTGDDLDFKLEPKGKMIIRPGRALLGLNKSGCSASSCTTMVAYRASTNLEIEIKANAVALASASMLASAAVALLVF